MPALLHPGVYVQEIPSGVRAIEGVPTSTTIFVGETERGPTGPTKIKGIADYERLFGGYLRRAAGGADPVRLTLRYAIDGFFANGGSTAYVLRAITPSPATSSRAFGDNALEAASPGAWSAGTVHGVVLASSDGSTSRFRLAIFYADLEDPGTLRLVEDFDRLSLNAADENYVVDKLLASRFVRWKRPENSSLTTVPTADLALATHNVSSPGELPSSVITALGSGNAAALAGGTGGDSSFPAASLAALLAQLDQVDDAALLVAAPDFWTKADDAATAALYYAAFRTYADKRPQQDLFYIADLPRQSGTDVTTAVTNTVTLVRTGGFATTSTMLAFHWPHVIVPDPIGVGRNPRVTLPPSGFAAGLYSRTDARRGVWKAPAGVDGTLNGVLSLQYDVLDKHQDDLNPIGINALRTIPGAGMVVWGARTSRPSSEWRYVPVRRTAMFLRKSIYNGIQWAVFEPNDGPLWQALRVTITAFMETQFRNGAFAGATSREAYFVKCDSQTTTEIDQANGVVNILVGFAPLRPAEFVVVRLQQMTALPS
ncbi:phage tail sheath family protein [Pyxidicoccus fallax]|uniref:Phage tail sheath family protein n=1 Tax=Pyxidicoccus fallax TaxID=394095 RepID=A0A848LUX6_9BACT|nr:phage tail sheath subtilisin-like domain-containing protein [Pyxidicoccus fallax]NMO21847.1 phage tail sheath family protein [Pyxidicoccus fallax]NPC83321.1 phage tail sheath family protein [Pyxidicoccus fallax]